MFEWVEQNGEHVFVAPIPTLWVVAIALVVAVVVLVRTPRGEESVPSARWLGGGLVALTLLDGCAIPSLGVWSIFADSTKFRPVWTEFWRLIALEWFLAAVLAGLVFVALRRTPQKGPMLAGMCGLGGVALCGLSHATLLVVHPSLPKLIDGYGAWVHRGRAARLVPLESGLHGWVPEPLTIDTDTPGQRQLMLRASTFLLRASRPRLLAVREEIGPAGFPLRVGHNWSYVFRTTSKKSLFGGKATSQHILSFRISGFRERLGVREFSLEVVDAKEGGPTWLAVADGKLYVDRGETMSEDGFAMAVPGQPGDFYFPPLGATCSDVTAPGSVIAVAGPTDCEVYGSTPTGQQGAEAMASIMSLGIVTPGLDRKTTATLLASEEGPADAPAAPVR